MGFLSQAGHIGLRTQTVKGSYNSPATAGAPVDEVVTLTSTATGGTFTLSFGGQTTAPIAFDAAAAVIETAFEALSTVGAGNGTCAGGPLNTTPVTITFTGTLAGTNVGPVTVDNALATGGTVVSAVTTQGAAIGGGIFLYHRSGSLGGNRELMIPDPEIGGNRDVPDAQLGPIAYSGEFEFYGRMDALPTLLKGALGAADTTGTAATGYTHVCKPTEDSLPWLSFEERIGNGYLTFGYTDCKINTLHLEAEANGYLMGTVGVIGLTQDEVVATDLADRDYDTTPMIVGSNVCVRWGGVDLPAKSFSIDINNNIEDDDFRLCSMTLGDLVEKRREITMSVTIRPNDSDLWKTAMWGSPAATGPLGQSYKDDVEIEFESYEDVPLTSPAVKYNTLIEIGQAIIAPFNVDPSGDDVIEHDIEIRAVRPDPNDPVLTATVINGLSSVR